MIKDSSISKLPLWRFRPPVPCAWIDFSSAETEIALRSSLSKMRLSWISGAVFCIQHRTNRHWTFWFCGSQQSRFARLAVKKHQSLHSVGPDLIPHCNVCIFQHFISDGFNRSGCSRLQGVYKQTQTIRKQKRTQYT